MEAWNSTKEDDDEDFYDNFLNGSRFWILRVLLPLVVIVGILGNGVTVVVLTRRRMRSSTNTYLTALAISDLLHLVFGLTLSLEHYPNSHKPHFYHYWAYYRFGVWLADLTSCISTWLTVTFTVERYVAVCHPMRGKMLCTESRARIAIIIVCFFCFLSTVATPFEHQLDDRTHNETHPYVGNTASELGRNDTYVNVYSWFWSVTFVFLPILLLGVFNSFLIHAVHNSKKQRCKMTQTDHSSSTQRQENKITVTLIAVVILFIICQIPTATLQILRAVHTNAPKRLGKLFLALGNICNFLVTINAAANFLLYCAFSAKYRRTLFATFLGKCYRVSNRAHSSVHTPEFSRISTGVSRSTIRERIPCDSKLSNKSSSYLMVPKNGTINQEISEFGPKSSNDMYK